MTDIRPSHPLPDLVSLHDAEGDVITSTQYNIWEEDDDGYYTNVTSIPLDLRGYSGSIDTVAVWANGELLGELERLGQDHVTEDKPALTIPKHDLHFKFEDDG